MSFSYYDKQFVGSAECHVTNDGDELLASGSQKKNNTHVAGTLQGHDRQDSAAQDYASHVLPTSEEDLHAGHAKTFAGGTLECHSSGVSFYSYGPPGTPHSDFVRIVSSKLPYNARPQRPGRTIQDWIVGCKSVGQVLALVDGHGTEFDCINTATAMHRIAKCYRDAGGGIHRSPFRDAKWALALQQVSRNLPSFQTRHLSGTLWALATLHFRGPELECVFDVARSRLQDFTCVDLALTAWSIATLRQEPPGLYEEISKLSVSRIAEFQPQALANICWATATLRKENDALIRHAALVAAKHMDAGVHFRPHEYSTIAWSMVLAQAREEHLFHRIAACTVRRVSEFGPQELTNTVWAFASLGVKSDGLFEAIGDECRVKLSHFNTQNITNVAWSYTHLAVDNPELLKDVANAALARMSTMNVQDLAQMALSLMFTRGHSHKHQGFCSSLEDTLMIVSKVAVAMVEKIRGSNLTFPDDAWIVHDLVLMWMDEREAVSNIGDAWIHLDGYVRCLFDQVFDFLRYTPLLRYAQPCGAVVQTVHMEEYQRAFRALDLRSLGIKYTGLLLSEMGFLEVDQEFIEVARAQLESDHAHLLAADPGAGSQNWCLFRFQVTAFVQGQWVEAEELEGIRVRSCGGDPVALTLLDAPFESHLLAVKLSNDRLNHRKRDAEFRALAHVAGVLRRLFPDDDSLMSERIWWGKNVNGWLQIYVTEVPCLSCLGAMLQFAKRFPHVDLRVSYPGSDKCS
mmetsp:Transcript_135910/g.434819  ORF Transcript_135910/g.434819 Transcript_135910/m.434819 type:complete len:743 (-) Transcript_135910:255-2483(-)